MDVLITDAPYHSKGESGDGKQLTLERYYFNSSERANSRF
jgi:hypothetical protein